ncbi:MAG TPA: alkaline phosphatase family protein [Ktedonosporobacter sp.]|nr:alkaline phosphatase family protein [Ktedonosporobacter sp.]
MNMKLLSRLLSLLMGTLVVVLASAGVAQAAANGSNQQGNAANTKTPIEHIVVIFQENVSFDHYFATYPKAQNPAGEPAFTAADGTPSVNGLSGDLLTHNPNLANPQLLGPAQAITCDQDHNYPDEQKSFDQGKMDKFVQFVSGGSCKNKNIVMDYYDGNTVTALWNYAQHYSMSDKSFGTEFGPSTVGAVNLISGQTHGATPATVAGAVANGSIIGDPRPAFDDCWTGASVSLSGTNVGDLLNAKNITWGWFQGGFRPSGTANGKAVCKTSHANIGGVSVTDYIPHHEPFQYYKSTANPHHLAPSSSDKIGQTDQANHQYDLTDFWTAADGGNLPAVSFLKAAGYQDGHAGYSDPLDEQHFLVNTINHLQKLSTWKNTAVVIAYDDSDGWYDHVMGPIVNSSSDPANDAVSGAGKCGNDEPAGGIQDRCGYGPRLPLLVISPFAKTNFVDHSVTDQSSILRFIEKNWKLGSIGGSSFDSMAGTLNHLFDFDGKPDTSPFMLDPVTGEPVK